MCQKTRLATYTLEQVADLYTAKRDLIYVNGIKVPTKTTHLQVVFKDNLACQKCGVKGSFFSLEREENQKKNYASLILYSNKTPFTKDHIIPKSIGGADNLANYTSFCKKCNGKKRATLSFNDLRKGRMKKGQSKLKIFWTVFMVQEVKQVLYNIEKQYYKSKRLIKKKYNKLSWSLKSSISKQRTCLINSNSKKH